jgi:hypothetical protein
MSPLTEGTEKVVVAEAFKDLPIQSETTAPRPSVAKARMGGSSAGSKPKWQMKAGSNWDNAVYTEENPDQFNIPKGDFPEGMDMQWCTETVFGQDVGRLPKFQRSGWTPVHASDFDGRFDGKWTAKGADEYIRKDGLVLCARPMEISIAARVRQAKAAKEQLALKAEAFTGGQISATGANHPTALATNKISRSIERIDIPTE